MCFDERVESAIQRKTIEKVDSLQAPATSLKFKQVYEHKPLVKRLGQKPCEPQSLKHSDPESGVPVIDLASESESSIIELSSNSETEVWTHRLIPDLATWLERKQGKVSFYLSRACNREGGFQVNG